MVQTPAVGTRSLACALSLVLAPLCATAQTIETHSFTNLNREVPDGSASGISDVRALSSAVASISSVRVKLRMNGEYDGDLYGFLRHANSARTNYCVLLNRPGRAAGRPYGYADSGLDVTFDAFAANGNIHDYQSLTNFPDGSPLAGCWQPDGRTNDPATTLAAQLPATSLDSFTGTDANGEWTLFLADVDSGGTNTLLGWELELSGAATRPVVFEPIVDQVAYVRARLILTNCVVNSNQFSGRVTFGLGPDAPAGAWVNPVNGVFRWTPAEAQARSTNVVSVWVRDSADPPVTGTNTFTVAVDDYVEVALGRTVLRSGQTSSVPVILKTSTTLTNLQAVLQAPTDRIIPLSLTGWAPEIGTVTLQQQATDAWRMEFAAAPGQALQSNPELAWLNVLAVSNRSAFIQLPVSEITNLQPNGLAVWRTIAGAGRAVVIEREPLLEALPPTNGLPNLVLFGIAGVSYDVQFNPALTATGLWQPIWSGTVPTNLWIAVPDVTNSGPAVFFRALEIQGQ
jgi:subtilisin-like proprotein convertase family protein